MRSKWLILPMLLLTVACMRKTADDEAVSPDLSSITDLKVLDVQPLTPVTDPNATRQLDQELENTREYSGEPVSLSFYKADIHDFFRAISEVAHVNFLIHEQVQGTITIEVKDVPWDQLVDTVLQFHKLTSLRKNNVIEILPRELADKETRVIKVNYSTADNIVQTLRDETALGRSGEGSGIMADKQSNSIVITDIPENIEKIRKLIASLDQAPQQVLLESLIVEVTLDDTNKLGIGWSFGDDGRIRNSWGDTSFDSSGGSNFPLSDVPEDTGFWYSLSINDALVRAQLNAYAQAKKARVLSHPKLVTYDNHEATMKVVERRFVQTSINTNTAAGVGGLFSNFEERDYGIILTVTPHINSNGDIVLEVKQDVSDLTGVDSNGNPVSVQRIIDTTLLLKNGQTMVLGGLIQEKEQNDSRGIPWFYKLPVLRRIFGTDEKLKKRVELLLFITPHLIRSFEEARSVTDTMMHQNSQLKPLDK